jgi:hypothetical protein
MDARSRARYGDVMREIDAAVIESLTVYQKKKWNELQAPPFTGTIQLRTGGLPLRAPELKR